MTALLQEANDLVTKGYMVLGQDKKHLPPTGATGKHPWRNEFVKTTYSKDISFLSVRHGPNTFAIDVDADPASKHGSPAAGAKWEAFNHEFNLETVSTGANRANNAGIYHFQFDTDVTEQDVKSIRVPHFDIIRQHHRFAVVRGLHPLSSSPYTGRLPSTDELPIFNKDMLEWFKPLSVSKLDTKEMRDFVNMGSFEPSGYLNLVKAYGYDVDVDWVVNQYCSQMRNTLEGSRNKRLLVAATQIFGLGASADQIGQLASAARQSGLEVNEIGAVLSYARESEQVFNMVEASHKWADHARTKVSKRVYPTINEIARLAVEQHNRSPLVSQQHLEDVTGITRKTIRGHLAKLEEAGAGKIIKQSGRQKNGLRHAHNFQLTLSGDNK